MRTYEHRQDVIPVQEDVPTQLDILSREGWEVICMTQVMGQPRIVAATRIVSSQPEVIPLWLIILRRPVVAQVHAEVANGEA